MSELNFVFVCHKCKEIISDWRGNIYTLNDEADSPALYLSFHDTCDLGLKGIPRGRLASTVSFLYPELEELAMKSSVVYYSQLEEINVKEKKCLSL